MELSPPPPPPPPPPPKELFHSDKNEKEAQSALIMAALFFSQSHVYFLVRLRFKPGSQYVAWRRDAAPRGACDDLHSCQPSRNGRDSPGILGLVPVVSRLSRNLRAPCASAFTRLDGSRSLNRG